ncbi:MAG: hypothetical protein LBD15_01955 [Holosporales bacterium]|jgi:hypothetical protein|nr:hypothetical protein [Holosporales bacterium]
MIPSYEKFVKEGAWFFERMDDLSLENFFAIRSDICPSEKQTLLEAIALELINLKKSARKI